MFFRLRPNCYVYGRSLLASFPANFFANMAYFLLCVVFFKRAPLITFLNGFPNKVQIWTTPVGQMSSIKQDPIHVVSIFLGFPFTQLAYNKTKSPFFMFFFFKWRSCHALYCCFFTSWWCIAITLSSSSLLNWYSWSFILLSWSNLATTSVMSELDQKCKGITNSCP